MHVNDGPSSEQRAALVGLEPCPDEVDIAVIAGAPEVAADLLTRSGQFGMLHRSSI
jgi:hypothetical protein